MADIVIGPQRAAVGIAAALAAGALATALYFEHVLGYAPCALCLWQRWPYYLGIPLAAGLFLLAPRIGGAMTAGLALLAALFVVGAGLGVYHAGVEWAFWEGPSACSAGAAAVGGDLLSSLRTTRIVPCNEASWRFLGLSFAGWNVVASILIVLVALAGLGARRRRSRYGSSSLSQ